MTAEMGPTQGRAEPEPTVASPAGPPDRPTLADRYELGAVLGHGGVGTVHVARDLVLHRAVAVKIFRPDAAAPDQAGRYEHEARLLASLSHPGLVTVFDAGIDSSEAEHPRPYLVMELVEGATLAGRLGSGPVSAAQTAALGAQVAAALAYVHGQGVVHRDVKPANILLADGGDDAAPVSAKLTDFGIARLIDSARMTMHGLTFGTANYLSPEQATGGEVGPPSDIYALGLVLLECLTGQVAYPGHGVEAAVARLHRPPSFPPWLDPPWARLLVAMTDPDPAHRPSALETAQTLSSLSAATAALPVASLVGMQTQVLQVTEPGGATRPLPALRVRRRVIRWGWIAATLVVAALIVVVAVIAKHASSSPSTVRPPVYPSVPGQLGSHLHQLQTAVQP